MLDVDPVAGLDLALHVEHDERRHDHAEDDEGNGDVGHPRAQVPDHVLLLVLLLLPASALFDSL